MRFKTAVLLLPWLPFLPGGVNFTMIEYRQQLLDFVIILFLMKQHNHKLGRISQDINIAPKNSFEKTLGWFQLLILFNWGGTRL
jgi:hypothetical protein